MAKQYLLKLGSYNQKMEFMNIVSKIKLQGTISGTLSKNQYYLDFSGRDIKNIMEILNLDADHMLATGIHDTNHLIRDRFEQQVVAKYLHATIMKIHQIKENWKLDKGIIPQVAHVHLQNLQTRYDAFETFYQPTMKRLLNCEIRQIKKLIHDKKYILNAYTTNLEINDYLKAKLNNLHIHIDIDHTKCNIDELLTKFAHIMYTFDIKFGLPNSESVQVLINDTNMSDEEFKKLYPKVKTVVNNPYHGVDPDDPINELTDNLEMDTPIIITVC